VDEEYPFWLSTGRVHVHYHTGTMTRVSPTLHAEVPEGKLEMHPKDGERLGVREGEKVKVASRRGEITAKVILTDRVDVGVVFMPFHFAETCANVLTNPAHDPTAKIPELKVCAVRVEKAA
ncbi:MAG: formate dehydrogenase subunit alpha, partial [Deltaproteobacteria bacterium]|nr:formate dehydrogenase subunit alpha [Deltaproteobacteria bacterium]